MSATGSPSCGGPQGRRARAGCDLRRGRDSVRQRIVEKMFGGMPPRADATWSTHRARRATQSLLSLQRVSRRLGDRGAVRALHDLSLDLRPGEVFGIAGVDGNGQKELGEVIAGQRTVTVGQVAVRRHDITNRGVAAATRPDRLRHRRPSRRGVGPGTSVAENAVLKTIGRAPFSKGSGSTARRSRTTPAG